ARRAARGGTGRRTACVEKTTRAGTLRALSASSGFAAVVYRAGAARPTSVLELRALAFARRRRRRRRVGVLLLVGERHRLALERRLEHLFDPAHRADLDAILDLVGDLREVLHVLLGNQHRPDAAAAGREQLLLQAPD